MVEKKTTTKDIAATPKATKKRTAKPSTKTQTTKITMPAEALNAENVGFKAGDVYQTLATATAPMSIEEVSKVAGISLEETLLGTGWLFKEGKVKGEKGKLSLA